MDRELGFQFLTVHEALKPWANSGGIHIMDTGDRANTLSGNPLKGQPH
jgi:hypothetical protein